MADQIHVYLSTANGYLSCQNAVPLDPDSFGTDFGALQRGEVYLPIMQPIADALGIYFVTSNKILWKSIKM